MSLNFGVMLSIELRNISFSSWILRTTRDLLRFGWRLMKMGIYKGCCWIIRGKIFKRNKRGKGSAIRDGLKLASGEYIILIDADLQYDPKDIKRILPLLKRFDLVNTRRLRKDPFHRKLLGKIFQFVVRCMFGIKLETQSTLRGFRKNLKKVKFKANGWAWDVEFLYKAKKMGYSITEIPIIYGKRKKHC